MPKLKARHTLRKGKRRKNHPGSRRRAWLVRALVRQTGGLCTYCREAVSLESGSPSFATIDHETPISRGGLDVLSNLRLACQRCNSEKGNGIAVDLWIDEEGEDA